MESSQYISQQDLNGFDRFYRANLVNSITGYKPAMLLGTQNEAGLTNLAVFSSVMHLGSDPALVGFIQRPVGVSGDTFRNIESTGIYTMNHVQEDFAERAHYTSARFESSVSEFQTCKFTPEYLPGFNAPFVKESSIKIGLELVEVIPIKHNNTQLVIGTIRHILISPDALEANGSLNLAAARGVCISGLENYHRVTPLASFPYASVNSLPEF